MKIEDRKFEIGDGIVVVNNGSTYSRYLEFINKHAKEFSSFFKDGYVPYDEIKGGIVGFGLHPNEYDILYIVKIYFKNRVFVIGEKGLSKIE